MEVRLQDSHLVEMPLQDKVCSLYICRRCVYYVYMYVLPSPYYVFGLLFRIRCILGLRYCLRGYISMFSYDCIG